MEIQVYDKINDVPSIVELGRAIAYSGMFGCEKEEQGTVFALQCIAERKPPLEMCKTYHLINGKLSKRADAMLADFRRAGGKFVFGDLKNRKVQSARVEFEGNVYEVSFSEDDAKAAGLLPAKPGSGWVKYPAAMMRARLISETLRAIAPEIVQGAFTPEEIADFEPAPAPRQVNAESKPAAATREVAPRAVTPPVEAEVDDIPMVYPSDLEEAIGPHAATVNAYLIKNNRIKDGQTWKNLPPDYLARVKSNLPSFLKASGVKEVA